MANINDLFDQFPDYDVFSGKTKPAGEKAPELKTPEPKNPEPRTPKPRTPRPRKPEPMKPEPVMRSSPDYGDGFGIADKPIKVKRVTGNNFLTIIYFPVLLLLLELILRLSCGLGFSAVSFLYTTGFTIPIASVFTLICTLFGNTFNRVLCNIFTFILTAFYLIELGYHDIFGRFLTFSTARVFSPEQFINAIADKYIYAIAIAVPFFINLIFGHKIFGFRKLRIPAKIVVIIIAVIIQIGAFSAMGLAKDTDSERVYNSSSSESAFERFGLLTMERLDIFNSK